MLMFVLACGSTEQQSYSYEPDNTGSGDSSDSDGDGFTDAEETAAGTNPNFAASRPYEYGNYVVGACEQGLPAELGPTDSVSMNLEGTELSWDVYVEGDGVQNVVLKDQFDQDVELHSFCGLHIMLVISSFNEVRVVIWPVRLRTSRINTSPAFST